MGDRKEIQSNRTDNPKDYPSNEKSTPELSAGTIIQSLPIGIITFDSDFKIIEANTRAEEIIKLDDYIDKSLAKGTDEKIWQCWKEILKKTLLSSQAQKFEDVEYTTNDQTILLRLTCTSLRQTKTSESPGGIILIEDVTEKSDMRNRLSDTERLAAVGRLASRVAHELNNPLDGILRYINLTIRAIEHENLEKPKEYLAQCRQGLMRMIQIVKELLEFSRCPYSTQEFLPIEQIIEDAIKTINTKAEALDVKIHRNYHAELPKIRSGNLFQVFCNFIMNALDSMPLGGEIRISTYPAKDNSIVVEFSDTGTGLPPENTEIIFEPFFTTKEKGKGTGLGLAICRDIVNNYNGQITARNSPEGGSIFTVYLPVPANP